jgi:hypothetical protein
MPVEIRTALAASIKSVTRDWTTAKRQADRQERVSERRLDALRQATRPRQVSIKDAAYAVMEDAYRKASSNGRLPANARQVMYAARPYILAHASKPWQPSTDQYFTQTLLPDFIEANLNLTAAWDVVFDDRGHFFEPHTRMRIGLGTLAVRQYVLTWTGAAISQTLNLDGALAQLTGIATSGPQHRYGAVLFVEKEGFDALWAAVNLANRFDLAIMSTKGMSVTAARQLVERLSEVDVPIYVLHDFDKAGFSILHTLRATTRRYRFAHAPRVIDLGLRLADVEALQLPSERVEYGGQVDPRINLATSGATEAEQGFLVRGRDRQGRWVGERVELNAMDSDQLVTWLEGKLTAAGVGKVVPDADTLAAAYQRAWRVTQLWKAIDQVLADDSDTPGKVEAPADLASQIDARIQGKTTAWDTAVWELVRDAPPDY